MDLLYSLFGNWEMCIRDSNRGLEIALVGHAQYFDVTRMFNDQLWYAEQYLNEKWVGDRQITFYNKVNHNGDWDIKVRES